MRHFLGCLHVIVSNEQCCLYLTQQDPRVLDAMLPYQVNYYGNPHSRTHAYGWESESAMEKARKVCLDDCLFYLKIIVFLIWKYGSFIFKSKRNVLVKPKMYCLLLSHCLLFPLQQVAGLIGADPREIVFTSGATESNNMSIKVSMSL